MPTKVYISMFNNDIVLKTTHGNLIQNHTFTSYRSASAWAVENGYILIESPKSEAIKLFAKDNNISVLDVNIDLLDSSDLMGIPIFDGKTVKWSTPKI